MEQPYMLPILYCQYHGCWCHGDMAMQVTSSHDINYLKWAIALSALGVNLKKICQHMIMYDILLSWTWGI